MNDNSVFWSSPQCAVDSEFWVSGISSREKRRQLCVNEAFSQLQQIIPCYPASRKMSKQEILRGAIRYMKILEYLLGMRADFT